MQRRLTAILAADVADYSGLMEADEAGTLQRLKANRSRVFDPCVAAHSTTRALSASYNGPLYQVRRESDAVLALQEQVELGRHLRVLQNHGRRRRAVQAHLVFLIARADAGERALDDEGGEVFSIHFREDDVDVGEAAVGDPHLLAVENPGTVGGLRCLRARAERIGWIGGGCLLTLTALMLAEVATRLLSNFLPFFPPSISRPISSSETRPSCSPAI